MFSDENKKYVPWAVFVWVVALASGMIGALWFVSIALMGTASEIKSDIASIKTEITWIKNSLGKGVTYK